MSQNDGNHIVNIIGRQDCATHKAELGVACYTIPSDISDRILLAICNRRAVKAGANGKISIEAKTGSSKRQPNKKYQKVS